MVQVKFYLLIAALCACCGLGSSGVTTEKAVVIPADMPKPEPVKEAEVPEKPVPPTTTSTTTETPKPDPTTTTGSTPAPTTSTTPAPTTTPAPAPTPTPAPAPTPAPGPLPPPTEHTWVYQNETSNVTCIVVQFAAQLNVTYYKTVNNVLRNLQLPAIILAYKILNVPANASVVGGSCDPADQHIKLSWPAPSLNNQSITNNMTLTYAKNDTLKSYGLTSLEFELAPALFVNASFSTAVSLQHGAAWQTPLATSYRCAPATRLNMTGDADSSTTAYLTLTKLQEEAFRSVNGSQFSAARECGGAVPDAVPIAVGCALGGLVLVVLVAYLVGRRRSSARGYLSM